MVVTIRPATPADAMWLGKNLRAEDEAEITASRGVFYPGRLVESLEISDECYTLRLASAHGTVTDNPCLIFGVAHLNDLQGIVWMAGTDDIRKAPLSILREARVWVDYWASKYQRVHNLVDLRNGLHVRWLQLLGFTFGEQLTNAGGFQFQYFSKDAA